MTELDDKIIAVAQNDQAVNHIDTIEELPAHFFHELRNFFEDYKKLEKKEVKVEEFQNKETAHQIVNQSIADYQVKFLWDDYRCCSHIEFQVVFVTQFEIL